MTAPLDPPHLRPPAPLWRRGAARALDAATVLMIQWTLIVIQVFWFMGSLSRRIDPEPWGRAFVPTLTFVVLSFLYEVVFTVRSKGQTPGKDIMKLRVVARSGADGLSTPRSIGRWCAPGLLILVPPLWLGLAAAATVVGLSAAMTGARRQGVHDLVFDTVVVPYDRDLEDASAGKRATSWRRLQRNPIDERFARQAAVPADEQSPAAR